MRRVLPARNPQIRKLSLIVARVLIEAAAGEHNLSTETLNLLGAASITPASRIEGFVASLIPEVAPFNIQISLVEPCSAKTELTHRNCVIGNTLPREYTWE
jgi:hypothetical protein